MDLSQFSTDDLKGLQSGDLTKVSSAALKLLQAHAEGSSSAPPASYLDRVKANMLGTGQAFNEALMGGVRGAAGIGATLIRPFESGQANADRRASIDSFMQEHSNPDSPTFQAGKLGTEIAGTAGVGGAIAAPVKVLARTIPEALPIANALASSGFTTGAKVAPNMLARGVDLGTRAVGGAVTGGTSMGLIDPEHAGTGALIGGALPPGLAGAGRAGAAIVNGRPGQAVANQVRNALQPRAVNAAEDLATALNASTPEQRTAIVNALRGAPTLVDGASPTVAQALQSPEASILQRVVYDSPGGSALRQKIAEQAQARAAALEGVAPTSVNGPAMAREDLGQTVARQMIPMRAAEKARIGGLYENVDPAGDVRLQLPLDEMQAARNKYLGPGTFGQGKGAADAMKTANAIGLDVTPLDVTKAAPLQAGRATGDNMTLGAAVRQIGIHPDELKGMSGFPGEVRYMKESKFGHNLINRNGQPLDRIAEKMWERGYLENADAGELIEKLSDEMAGFPVLSRNADPEILFGKARDAGMPDKFIRPGVASPVALDWKTLQNFRSSVGDAAAAAEAKGAMQDAAALRGMQAALGKRVDAAGAQGLLKDGESMPLDVYARWTDANSAHAAMKARYDTGPLAGIFRKGPNGEPALQGGEIAARAWGARPGLADDVQAFKRLVGENPALMGQFKGMVTTEGAGTADAAGNLTTKFSKWVAQTLPGLREAFSDSEVQTLQRIAADIDRHAAAVKAGTSLGGSNTYQNAANALSLGVLDSPVLSKAANMVPGVKYAAGPALEGVRNFARNAKANRLADILSDSGAAANALDRLGGPVNGLASRAKHLNGLVAPAIYRGAPLADRR